MGGQPPLHDLGVVDDHVVADHCDQRRGRVGGQQLIAEAVKLALTALRQIW
jgi:hypothetical protein